MRVALVTQWFPPEKAAIPADLAAELAQAGHSVTVLTGFPNYPYGRTYSGWTQRPWRDEWATDGYRVRRVAEYPSHDRSALRRTASYTSFAATSSIFGLRALRSADVTYVYHPPITAAAGAWMWKTLAHIPFVLHVQDLWPESVLQSGMVDGPANRVLTEVLTSVCRRVYRAADAVVTISPGMRRHLSGSGVPDERLHTVLNWADERLFFPRDMAIDRADGDSGKFTVMFAGNIGEAQGLDTAVRAAALVSDLPGFRLSIVGDGLALPHLRELVRDLGLSNVDFVPAQPIERMNDLTATAQVQLVILRQSAFLDVTVPSKLGAILAAGLPVLCAAGRDATEIVRAAGAGWTCSPGDPEALARAYRVAYTASTGTLSECGRRGRAYYVDNLSRSTGTVAIRRILEGLAGSRFV